MATRLYRLGRLSYRRRWAVLLLWVVVLVGAGSAAAALQGPYSSEFSIAGTESQEGLDTLDERFPEAGLQQASANVVFAAPAGETLRTPQAQAAVAAVLDQVRQDPDVASVSDPYALGGLSADGRIARSIATYSIELLDVDDANREALFAAAEPGRDAGLQVELSGTAATDFEQVGGVGELLGVAVAALVLLAMFGSLVAAGLPLLTALFGIGIGMSGITALTGFVELSQTAPILALMLGLAVGIDYALFITSRHRHQLLVGDDGEEAAGRAVATAGSAVVFAGLTVVIALAGLLLTGITFLAVMGLAAAATVVVAVLVALTLLPALLGFAGDRVLGRRGRAARDTEGDGPTAPLGERWGRFVVRHKVPVLIVGVLGLLVVALPAAALQTAFPDEGQLSESTTQRRAYDLLAQGFGAGSNGPLVVVVENDAPAGVDLEPITAGLRRVEGVRIVTPPVANAAGDTFLINVIPETGPADPRTVTVMKALRAAALDLEDRTGTRLSVTGMTGLTVDVNDRLADALPVYLVVVIGLALLLLTVVFRSVLVPVKAAVGFLLTVLTTFGALVAVFQWGWLGGLLGVDQPGPVQAFLPIFMIGIIFGLAMDYEVFLVTRMREEHVHGLRAADAVVAGMRHSGRVVTAAALIMISVFAAFMASPDAAIKSFGFSFAFAIAVDAFVVRMTLVPAVLALVGERAWWLPRWLDRLVPQVDVEGSSLRLAEPEAPAVHREPAPV